MLSCMLTFVACSDDPEQPQPVPADETPAVTVAVGEIGERSIELVLSAKNAGHVACMHVLSAYAEETPSALDVFRQSSFVSEIGDGEIRGQINDLEPGTSYVIYAAARMDETYGEVKKLEVTTAPLENMLSFVEATRNTFTYRVDVPEGTTFQHCYVEGWYFDYMLESEKHEAGPDFNMDVFLWNMLVNFGMEAEGPQNIRWYAGMDNPRRDEIAKIVGGKKYYALFSLYKAEGNWYGTPEAVSFETEPVGKSDASINVIAENITTSSMRIRMEADSEKVHFFYYGLYRKESFDEMKATAGEQGMMDYLYEYGHSAANTYTDEWGVAPGESFMLGIMGVDTNGDLFYQEHQFESEALKPELAVTMQTFERELQGYHAYDTFEVSVSASYFGEINTESALWFMQPKAQFESMLDLYGMTLDQLVLAVENSPMGLQYLMAFDPWPLEPEWAEQLAANGYFMDYLTDNEPGTEYYFVCAVPYEDTYRLAYAVASTEALPQEGVVDDEYKAYLGEWTLSGQSTEDYYTRKSYTLRFEELTPNRSFKVYGCSDSNVAEEFPFEVRYHSDTKKISIGGHQVLGTRMQNGKELQVFFEGFLLINGNMYLSDGYTGCIFEGRLNGDRLSLFPGFVVLQNRSYEFRAMGYAGYDPTEDACYSFDDDYYQIVNFIINRVTSNTTAVKRMSSAGSTAELRAMNSLVWRPEMPARAAAPAVRDASLKEPAVFVRR